MESPACHMQKKAFSGVAPPPSNLYWWASGELHLGQHSGDNRSLLTTGLGHLPLALLCALPAFMPPDLFPFVVGWRFTGAVSILRLSRLIVSFLECLLSEKESNI